VSCCLFFWFEWVKINWNRTSIILLNQVFLLVLNCVSWKWVRSLRGHSHTDSIHSLKREVKKDQFLAQTDAAQSVFALFLFWLQQKIAQRQLYIFLKRNPSKGPDFELKFLILRHLELRNDQFVTNFGANRCSAISFCSFSVLIAAKDSSEAPFHVPKEKS
jgi:hypothetical protein